MLPDPPAPRGQVVFDRDQSVEACAEVAWLLALEEACMDAAPWQLPCTVLALHAGWGIVVGHH